MNRIIKKKKEGLEALLEYESFEYAQGRLAKIFETLLEKGLEDKRKARPRKGVADKVR
ncbi:hypothetical protein OAA99_01260 [Omnitrophica bacterium]|nr:hypothetical protein [Candidatus Omnitrophota bacterium]